MDKKSSDVLKSKRFWTMLIGLIATILVGMHPALEAHIDTLIPGILGIIGLLIGGYTAQDVAREFNGGVSVSASEPVVSSDQPAISQG